MDRLSILIVSESLTGHLLKDYFQRRTEFNILLKDFQAFNRFSHQGDGRSKTIIMADATLPGLNECLKQESRDKKVIVNFLSSAIFNVSKGDELENEAVKAGIKGIFYLDESLDGFIREVEYLRDGGVRIPKKLLFNVLQNNSSEGNQIKHCLLTPRENEIINIVKKGTSNREIAHQLFISESTVKRHMSNIFEKIGINDRRSAVAYLAGEKM